MNGIAAHLQHVAAVDLIVNALYDHFDDALVSLWSLNTSRLTPEGIPLPSVNYIWRQTNPTAQQLTDLGHVALFVGQVGDGVRVGQVSSDSDVSHFEEMHTPYAVAVLFGECVSPAVSDAKMGRRWRAEELLHERAARYLGAIKHVISERVHTYETNPAVFTTIPRADFPDVSEVRIGESELLMAQAHYTFDVVQHVKYPLNKYS